SRATSRRAPRRPLPPRRARRGTRAAVRRCRLPHPPMTLHLPNTAIVADTAGQGAARKRPLSLPARQLLAASLGLVAFLGLTGLALDRAFVETARSALQERLTNYATAYLAGMEFTRSGQPLMPPPPDERFLSPGAGLYARIEGRTASGEPIEWE